MAKEWTHVRVQKTTAADLLALVARLDESYGKGYMDAWWEGEQPSIDGVIRFLLSRRARERRRASASRKARRAKLADTRIDDLGYVLNG